MITNGYGAMYPYADRIDPHDRWAIVAYIRALQLSQRAKVADVLTPRSISKSTANDSSRRSASGRGPAWPRLLVASAFLDPKSTAAGWLVGFVFWSQILVGSLTLMTIHRLTGGRWGLPIAPAIEPAAACFHLPRTGGTAFCRAARALSVAAAATRNQA